METSCLRNWRKDHGNQAPLIEAVVVEKKRSGQEFRWSVRRKTDAVMRLLRGEDLDTVARELRVEPRAHGRRNKG